MRRLIIFVFYDPFGRVDDYVLHLLGRLRPRAEHVLVVSNGALDGPNRARLEGVADTVVERENVGLDAMACKEALAVLGPDALASYDELLMMNGTFFGPVGSFDAVFDDMDARDVDFWGMTEHAAQDQHPFDKHVPLHAHLQSYWIAVRRSVFTSQVWADYWDAMPEITSYAQAVLVHETAFTRHMVDHGFTYAVAFPFDGTGNPIMDAPAHMLRAGCPVVKRRLFFGDPLHNESAGIDGRELVRLVEERGYPLELLYQNLVRTAQPRRMATNLGLLEVLPDVDLGYDPAAPPRVVAVVHAYYPDLLPELLDRLDGLPDGYDLVVTTSDEDKRVAIRETLRRRGRPGEVRIVGSNRGRDISAFLVDCRDVLESGEHDLVVKLHTKRSPQDGPTIGPFFRRHLLDGLLSSPGYAANVLRLFQQHPTLGMVFPPIYHVGYPTLGHAWFGNKAKARAEAERLGIMVPFDQDTPLAPFGSMFIARPEALRPLLDAKYTHDDFPVDAEYRDGTLTHIVERLLGYSALAQGFHVREVMDADLVAVNYSFLEYRAIAVGAHLPAYPSDQIRKLRRLTRFWTRHRERIRNESRSRRRQGWSWRARTEGHE